MHGFIKPSIPVAHSCWLHAGLGVGVIPQLAMRTAEARTFRGVPLVEPAIRRGIVLMKRQGATLGDTSAWLRAT